MRLRTLKKSYLRRMTLLTISLTLIVGFVYYTYLPHRYFVCFPFIPAFFFLYGWANVSVWLFFYKYRPKYLISSFMVMKGVKFILSIVFILLYQWVVGHEILAFSILFLVFYIAFLIFETSFLVKVELKVKSRNVGYVPVTNK